ncbi:MAG: type II toxin-antitoxin system VapC family toxin [Terriglobia bacterium]
MDTSVAVKWFADEGGPEQAKAVQLFQAFEQGRCKLRAPELLYFEIANALMYSYKLSSSQLIDSLELLQRLKIEVELLNWSTLMKAVEIASACGATIYDSYFLALALETDSVLITADEVFLRKARRFSKIVSLRLLQLTEQTQ